MEFRGGRENIEVATDPDFVVNHVLQNRPQKQSRVGDGSQVKTYFPKILARVPIIPLVCSVENGNFNKKGITSCTKSFSGQRCSSV